MLMKLAKHSLRFSDPVVHKLLAISHGFAAVALAVLVVAFGTIVLVRRFDPERCYLICQICWPCPDIRHQRRKHIRNYDIKI